MTEPKQPADPPRLDETPAPPPDPTNHVPPELVDAEPKGRPTSDRQATETAANPAKHQSS